MHECQKLSTSSDQIEREFLTQDHRHDGDLTESVMLGPAFQTSWVMHKLHDNPCNLPDLGIFVLDAAVLHATRVAARVRGACLAPSMHCKSIALVLKIAFMHLQILFFLRQTRITRNHIVNLSCNSD